MKGGRDSSDWTNRRRFLQTTAALAGTGLAAGCVGGDGGEPETVIKTVEGEDRTVVRTVKVTQDEFAGLETFQNEAGVRVGATIDDVLELADREGSMTIYATIDREPMQKWIAEVRNQHDVSLNIQHITGSGEPLWSRWNSEYQSGNVAASIFISGSNVKNTWTSDPVQTMQLNAEMMPTFGESPDKFKDTENQYWLAIRQILGHVFYNTNEVNADDANSWMDIVTDDRWADQNIGWDPTPNMFLMTWLLETQGREFFESLRDQRPRWVDSHTDLARFTGAGEFPVAFTYTHKMGRFGNDLPVDFFRFDKAPSSVSPAVISNKAPEPNTAILFLNFLGSVEGQRFLGQTGEYVPWHPEVEYAAWPPVWPPEGYEADVILPQKDLEPARTMWQEVMGDLVS